MSLPLVAVKKLRNHISWYDVEAIHRSMSHQ